MNDTCTDFCKNLKSIDLKHGVLPSNVELIEKVQFSDEDRERGRFLGTWDELQQRDQCKFCQLVVTAISDDSKPTEGNGISLDQPIRIFIFPGEQSFRLSYPSSLGLRLAFVAEGPQHASGPDTGRLVHETGIQVSQVKGWLSSCDKNHESCTLEIVEHEQTDDKRSKISSFNESATSNFRVIDLELGCVTPSTLDAKYVTLSYVWGNIPMFRLQKDNFKQLSTKGSLENIRKDLPKTVNDAIDLVKAMNERYLWIDGLCLVQDDEDDVSLGVEMMNSIYHGSYFTIVAGSGRDGNAGLPGIGQNPRNDEPVQTIQEIAPGIKMTILHSIDWHLSRSIYNERGWTLQELVLPRRTVVFINGQVYFRCQEANWSEESWADKWTHWLDADDGNISRIPDSSDGFIPSFWAYQKLCEDYSRRKLRSDGDTLRALAGITRPLTTGMATSVIEGLPGYYINHFLLFISSNGDLRRRSEFASFSWAGWEGRIMWPRENFVWYDGEGKRSWDTTNIIKYFRHNRIVEWYALYSTAHLEYLTFEPWDAPSRVLRLMQEHPKVFLDTDKDPKRDDSFRLWHGSSGMHGDLPHWEPLRGSFINEDEEAVEARWLQPRSGFSIKAFDLANGQAEFDRLVKRIENTPERLVLQNWMAVRRIRVRQALERKSKLGPRPSPSQEDNKGDFRFRPPVAAMMSSSDKKSKSEDRRKDYYDKRSAAQPAKKQTINDGPKIPSFPPYTVLHFITISMHLILGTSVQKSHDRQSIFDCIPGISLLSATGQLAGSLHPDNLDLLPVPGSKVECLIVSRSNTPTTTSALWVSNEDKKEQLWNLFWILYVVWKDGIAERRGVGQILSSAFEMAVEPKPGAKLILLG